MKIQYASDLHLDLVENKAYLKDNPIKPIGDILILAGDIIPFCHKSKYDYYFDWLSDNFKTVYWVGGNHDWWDMNMIHVKLRTFFNVRKNVHFVNNMAFIRDDVKIILSTLWSKLSVAYQYPIQQRVHDFQKIKYGDNPITADYYNQLHDEAVHFIKTELKKNDASKVVVATHHVPTLMNFPQLYKEQFWNEAFATELHDLIADNKIDYWIYGHSHRNIEQFSIGNCKLVTNQLGYVYNHGEETFNHEALINI